MRRSRRCHAQATMRIEKLQVRRGATATDRRRPYGCDDADRLTTGDRMTAVDRLPAPSAARRAGGCVTRVSDADVAPHLDPAHGPESLSWRTRGLPPPGGDDVGDDWEEQQRRWAGGRAPIAAQPQVAHVRGGTVRGGTMRGEALAEDFSEIQEDDRGVQGDRYGSSGASNTAAHDTGNWDTPQQACLDQARAMRRGIRRPRCVSAAAVCRAGGGNQGGARRQCLSCRR